MDTRRGVRRPAAAVRYHRARPQASRRAGEPARPGVEGRAAEAQTRMRRPAMDWVARLYPARWRQRYGAEFGALLEESGGGWSATVDILKGALAMQMRSWTVWQFVAGCAMTGAVVAGVASWMAPKQYVSTAVLRVDADAPAGREWLG